MSRLPLSQCLNFAVQVPYNAKDCKTEEQLKQWCLGLKAEKCRLVASRKHILITRDIGLFVLDTGYFVSFE